MKRNEYVVKPKSADRLRLFYKNRYHHELFMDREGKIQTINSPRPDVKWFNFFSFVIVSFGLAKDNPIILGDE